MPQKRKPDLHEKKTRPKIPGQKKQNKPMIHHNQHGMDIYGAEDGNMICAF